MSTLFERDVPFLPRSVSFIFIRSLASFLCPFWQLTGLNANF